MFVSIMVSCLGTHRFIASVVHAPRRVESWADKVREVTATFSNRSFVALMVAGLIGAIATGLGSGLDLYITNYFWELTPKQLSMFPLVALVSAFIGVALAPALSEADGLEEALDDRGFLRLAVLLGDSDSVAADWNYAGQSFFRADGDTAQFLPGGDNARNHGLHHRQLDDGGCGGRYRRHHRASDFWKRLIVRLQRGCCCKKCVTGVGTFFPDCC